MKYKVIINTLLFCRKELMEFAFAHGYKPIKNSFTSFEIEGNINVNSFLANIRYEFPIKYISGSIEPMEKL